MAKKVFMIAPFEALTGNLSGDQNLQYAENNNPAYEAPNGTQYARNYRTRYVGARRGKDGLVYFQVKQTTATVLKASTRRTMAVIGVTAAIRSALMQAHAADWSKINQAFNYLKAQELLPEGQDTFNKWFSAQIKNMLVYHRATWAFTQASISFTIHNPYDLASADALGIKQSIWLKFANVFAFSSTTYGGVYYSINSTLLFAPYATGGGLPDFNMILKVNQHIVTMYAPMSTSDENLTWNSHEVYTAAGVAVLSEDTVIENEKYTTAVTEP